MINGKQSCVTSVLHWHSAALHALQFTDDGTYLLSGGQVWPFFHFFTHSDMSSNNLYFIHRDHVFSQTEIFSSGTTLYFV